MSRAYLAPSRRAREEAGVTADTTVLGIPRHRAQDAEPSVLLDWVWGMSFIVRDPTTIPGPVKDGTGTLLWRPRMRTPTAPIRFGDVPAGTTLGVQSGAPYIMNVLGGTDVVPGSLMVSAAFPLPLLGVSSETIGSERPRPVTVQTDTSGTRLMRAEMRLVMGGSTIGEQQWNTGYFSAVSVEATLTLYAVGLGSLVSPFSASIYPVVASPAGAYKFQETGRKGVGAAIGPDIVNYTREAVRATLGQCGNAGVASSPVVNQAVTPAVMAGIALPPSGGFSAPLAVGFSGRWPTVGVSQPGLPPTSSWTPVGCPTAGAEEATTVTLFESEITLFVPPGPGPLPPPPGPTPIGPPAPVIISEAGSARYEAWVLGIHYFAGVDGNGNVTVTEIPERVRLGDFSTFSVVSPTTAPLRGRLGVEAARVESQPNALTTVGKYMGCLWCLRLIQTVNGAGWSNALAFTANGVTVTLVSSETWDPEGSAGAARLLRWEGVDAGLSVAGNGTGKLQATMSGLAVTMTRNATVGVNTSGERRIL